MSQKANGKYQSTDNGIEHMIRNFKDSNKISIISFSDVPIQEYIEGKVNKIVEETTQMLMDDNTTVTVCTHKQDDNTITFTEINDENLSQRVATERVERRLLPSEGLFIAVAWILKPALRFFMLCPEVVFLDVTTHSNNKGFHLLTFSSRTLIGKQIVWVWIFIPNQQQFSFRWVFQQSAIPVLLPKWLRDRATFFMKDTDPQQRNELLGELKNVFVNATEGTCGFHIVNM